MKQRHNYISKKHITQQVSSKKLHSDLNNRLCKFIQHPASISKRQQAENTSNTRNIKDGLKPLKVYERRNIKTQKGRDQSLDHSSNKRTQTSEINNKVQKKREKQDEKKLDLQSNDLPNEKKKRLIKKPIRFSKGVN